MVYHIITSAYNEELNIERTLESVIKQTILPEEWIIINDGSSDKTKKILDSYGSIHDWIHVYHYDKDENINFGEHVSHNMSRGIAKIKNEDWNFIIKLDADLDIDRKDFFEYQFKKMRENPRLGISSGITYSTHTGKKILTKNRPYWRTGGAMKVYRKECFTDIGGIQPLYGWDGLDEYLAMYNGWQTRTFFELHVNHLGKKRALNREKQLNLAKAQGTSLYQRGFPIEFVLLKAVSLLKKSIRHSLSFLKGYFSAKKTRMKQFVNQKQKRFIRNFQYKRILDRFTDKKMF